jgi:hypothetical protein
LHTFFGLVFLSRISLAFSRSSLTRPILFTGRMRYERKVNPPHTCEHSILSKTSANSALSLLLEMIDSRLQKLYLCLYIVLCVLHESLESGRHDLLVVTSERRRLGRRADRITVDDGAQLIKQQVLLPAALHRVQQPLAV